ncbi:iron ABC transporter permease [Streptomyces parvus]|uniref:Iron ABC transporter permease n=1 Tax=Streptomyces parvus TaxID=66428 RepID=A0A5D4IYD9_9ACTN|nr:iron ABC transporter permease [Streptomyces parvus]TYR56660.1 iron ABC transporter permease [Streptomyces parvus]
MQTPRTGTTASAPEHDSSTLQLDGGEADRPTAVAAVPATPAAIPGDSSATADPRRRTVAAAVAGLAFAVLLLTALSLSIGAGEVGAGGVLDYLLGRDGARENARLSLVVGDLRLPRTLTALLVGAALGVAGCLLQAVTRNPLAETGLLGVNAGASLGVVAGIALLGFDSGYAYLVCAFVGAVVASGLVLLISGRRGGGSPMRLVLAGAALGATFGGLTSVIVVNSAETYDRFRFWVLGSLAGVEGFGELGRLAPVLALGFVVALLVARPLSALALGDDLARSLGHRPPVIRTVVAIGVTLLTAAAVALAGPISFLGLLAGFLARALAGALLLAVVLSAYAGQSDMGVGRTFRAVFGQGDRFDVLLVQKFRLGRIVAGLTAGAALGLAGCLTQTLARNRLATPELLGVNDGATAAVLLSVTLSATGTFGAWWAGPIGALVAVIVVTTVSGGLGQRGYRVLVVGLAMSALASAITQVVLSRRSLSSAGSLYVWTSGSLNGRSYSVAVPVLIGLAVLVPISLAVARHLGVLRFDDATASSLGSAPGRIRALALLLAVALAGLAVGICGPVGFVALASPVIASRLAGPLRVPLVGSMLTGAVLVVAADTLGRIVLDGVELPVGIVTTVLGGPFLLWVLLGRSAATRV